jgi:predicted RNA-binding Zn ribbon-like protein
LGSVTPRSRPARKEGTEREDLAIRFVNTVAWRLRTPGEERLGSPDALLAWLGGNGIGGAGRLEEIAAAWRRHPERGRGVHERAIALREAVYGILIARIRGGEPPREALDLFNRLLAQATPRASVEWRGDELAWGARSSDDGSDLLAPVVIAAAALMTGPSADRVRQCQDDRGCGWLFVDESRAGNRRWCSMGDCGNRAKAHRHYQRVRSKARTS